LLFTLKPSWLLKAFPKFPELTTLTYIFIAKLAFIQTILSLVAALNIEIHQIDIKRTYLNKKLSDNEVIYMKQLSNFEDLKFFYYVYHFQKTLYDLKQSDRHWY